MRRQVSDGLIFFIFLCIEFSSCRSGITADSSSIATDSASINHGRLIFNKNCSSCHNFRQDGMGPDLSGLTTITTAEWIKTFIKDPAAMINSGDKRAGDLHKKFHAIMPSFSNFSNQQLDSIISFLEIHKTINNKDENDPAAIKNPIPAPIPLSNLVLELQPVTTVPHSANKSPFTRIVKLDFIPKTNKLFIADLRGKLYKIIGDSSTLYMDIKKQMPHFISEPGLATGLGSFAFHPDFVKNGLLYTSHAEAAYSKTADFAFDDSIKTTLQWVVCEWKTEHPGADTFSGSCRELFRVNMVSGIHGVQEICFDPFSKPGDEDYGQLYIGVGDGGCAENGYPFLAHSKGRIWGTIIRIDPARHNSNNGRYGIPEQNPFFQKSEPKTVREIYAYGFRNPNRISWSGKDKMFASNIGQANIEAVNVILKGHDYGWPLREGSFLLHINGNLNKVYSLPHDDSLNHFTYPVIQYDHDEGKAIAGGYEYLGKKVPQLTGKYLFGDIVSGRLFYAEASDMKNGKQAAIKEWQVSFRGKKIPLVDLCGSKRVDLRFGRDKNGEIYLFTKADGRVYRLMAIK